MVSKKNGRKARKQNPQNGRKGSTTQGHNQSDLVTTDEHHNLSSPCCSLLEQIVAEIFPEASASSGNDENNPAVALEQRQKETSLLSKIVRSYVLEQRQQELLRDPKQGRAVTRNDPPSSPNKRKKRRKKKRGKQQATISTDADPAIVSHDSSSITENLDKATTTATACSTAEGVQPESNNGGTPVLTTTPPSRSDLFLDQILSDIEGVSPVPNRDLESFVSFLALRYEQELRQQSTKESKKKSKDPPDLTNVLPSVEVQQIKDACKSVGCRACQVSAQAYASSSNIYDDPSSTSGSGTPCIHIRPSNVTSTENKNNYTSPLAIPVCGIHSEFRDTDNDMHYERAMDYVAMEEACERDDGLVDDSASDELSLALSLVADSKGQGSLLQLTPQLRENDDAINAYPLTVKNVEDMIRRIVLPCGLNEVDIPSDYPFDEQDLKIIQTMVDEQEPKIAARLKANGEAIRKVQREVMGLKMSTMNFDAKLASTLLSYPVKVQDHLEELMQVLLAVTQTFHKLVAHHHGHKRSDVAMLAYFKERVDALWGFFSTAVFEASSEVINHDGCVMQLAHRPGSVPAMALHSLRRRSNHEMLKAQLVSIANLNKHFVEILLGYDQTHLLAQPNSETPALVTTLYTYEAFYAATCEKDGVLAVERNSFLVETASAVEYVHTALKDFCGLICTPECGSVSDLIGNRKQRYQDVQMSVTALRKRVQEMFNQERAGWAQYVALDQQVDELLLQLERGESNDIETDDISDPLFQDSWKVEDMNGGLQEMATTVLAQWRLLLCSRTQLESVPSIGASLSIQLPFELRKWMETRHVESSANEGCFNGNSCDGSGGKRRVTGCISGLLYRWLSVRCMEWHADLTQHELLDAMEDATVLEKKAKKKREKKGTAISSDSVATNPQDPVGEDDVATALVSPKDKPIVQKEQRPVKQKEISDEAAISDDQTSATESTTSSVSPPGVPVPTEGQEARKQRTKTGNGQGRKRSGKQTRVEEKTGSSCDQTTRTKTTSDSNSLQDSQMQRTKADKLQKKQRSALQLGSNDTTDAATSVSPPAVRPSRAERQAQRQQTKLDKGHGAQHLGKQSRSNGKAAASAGKTSKTESRTVSVLRSSEGNRMMGAERHSRKKRNGAISSPVDVGAKSETGRIAGATEHSPPSDNHAKPEKHVEQSRAVGTDTQGLDPQKLGQRKGRKKSPKSRRDKTAPAAKRSSEENDAKSMDQAARDSPASTSETHCSKQKTVNGCKDNDQIQLGLSSSEEDPKCSGEPAQRKCCKNASGAAQNKKSPRKCRRGENLSKEEKHHYSSVEEGSSRVRVVVDYGSKPYEEISAEDFLVARLHAILKHANEPHGSKEPCVVFM